MRVVITGGSGLIGRALAAELAGAGHEVGVTSRHPDGVRDLPAGVELAQWDTASAERLASLIDGVDAVVHLVGESLADGRWTEERKRRILESRVRSTTAVAAALAAAGSRPGVLVQASGVGYYGARGEEEITEASSAGEGFLADICRTWEESGAAVEELGVRRVVVRTGIVLSTDGGALPKMALPFKLFAGGPVAGGRQWMSWIHLDDEVGAIRFLLEDPTAADVYNLTAPTPERNRDFSAALGRALHRPSLAPVPGFALRLLYGEMSQLLTHGQRVLPRRLLEAGYTFRHPAVREALEDLLG
ncbi:MAG: TIGR01777 family oxidoreductase [Thermoanaerobaculia bacterium]